MGETFVVQDVDREGLVEHFAIEAEAKSLREWVAKSDGPREAGFEARLALATRRREEGNLAFKKSEWSLAIWLYLAGLHAMDYSKKDRLEDGIEESPSKARQWQEAVLMLLSNVAAAFGAKDDNYNAIRSADLGLAFADKLRTTSDAREAMRAKLLYRRGVAKARANDDAAAAAADIAEAVALDGGKDAAMQAALKRLKAQAKKEKPAFADLRGAFQPAKAPDAAAAAAAAAPEEEDDEPKTKVPNIAERRAARRKVSRRLVRWARAVAAKFPVGNEKTTRAAVLGLTAVACWLAIPKSGGDDDDDDPTLALTTWRFRIVVAGLVIARLVDFVLRDRSRRRPLLARPNKNTQ